MSQNDVEIDALEAELTRLRSVLDKATGPYGELVARLLAVTTHHQIATIADFETSYRRAMEIKAELEPHYVRAQIAHSQIREVMGRLSIRRGYLARAVREQRMIEHQKMMATVLFPEAAGMSDFGEHDQPAGGA